MEEVKVVGIKGEDIKIQNIILIESEFKRLPIITLDQNKLSNEIKINVNVQLNDNNLQVTETLIYEQVQIEQPDKKEVSASIKYVGIYEFIEGNEYTDDQKNRFGRVNGGAMLFPYIREHLAVMTQKGGIKQVILPPFNFTTLGKTELTIEGSKVKG